MQKQVVQAFSSTIHIGLSTAIEGYVLPDGSFRYGFSYVSKLLGYERNYLSHAIRKGTKKIETLQGKGFTCDLILINTTRSSTGSTRSYTMSFDDFCILVEHEAVSERNLKAIALLTASFREVLRSRTQEAFGLPQDTFEKRIAFFQLAYSERERLLSEDREDIEQLELYSSQELSPWWDYLEKTYAC